MTALVTTLDNGLRVATDRMPGYRTAAVAVHVQVGGRHEQVHQNGIAHFLEHMAFKGTERRSALQISEEIEHVGGFLNAATGKEITAYYASGLGEDVPLAIDILADIILNSKIAPEDIELERGVILNEIGDIEDSPTDVLFEALGRTAYPDQAFGRPIIGTVERVSAFSRSDIAGFLAEHYAPNRMILTAAGDVDHDQVVDIASRHFGDSVALDKPSPEPSNFQGSREHRESRAIEQVHWALAFESPRLLDPKDPAARVYSVVMGGGSSSRLFAEARERRGLCYSISAHVAPSSDTGTITVHASTGRDEIEELAFLCMDELAAASDRLTEREVVKARNQIRVAVLASHENPMSRVERMGAMLTILGRLEPIEKFIDRYNAVTLDQVREFAGELASRGNATMAVLGPTDNAPDIAALMRRLAG